MVRLDPKTARALNRTNPTPKQDMLQAALAAAEQGWLVFPLRPGSKVPLLPRAHDKGQRCNGECGRDGHGAWDGTTDPDKIRRWWSANPNAGIGASIGEDRLVIDVDTYHGGQIPDQAPQTRTHYSGRGGGSVHLIYRIEPGTLAAQIKSGTNVLGEGVDVRAGRGSYIVLPPTPHPDTGQPYTVGPENDGQEHLLTDEQTQALWGSAGVELGARGRAAKRGLRVVKGTRTANSGKSLAELLADPPVRGQGRTNDWLTRVAGHYAKQYRGQRDLYETHVRAAAALVKGEPYPEYEIEKTLESIWAAEENGHPEREATEDTGWLVSNRGRLWCQVRKVAQDGSAEMGLAPWGDFDLICRGVAVDEVGKRMYWVSLVWGGTQIQDTLDSETLGDDRLTRKWLASRGASVDPPANAVPRTATGTRLIRYLNSQKPAEVRIVDTLGWHPEIGTNGGFVTHDGVITADGPMSREKAGVVANPRLVERDVAPYHYGFAGGRGEEGHQVAREVLREVLTFQEEQTAAVFGAWWAACLLRPQIQERSSLFPFFGIEATSESGKTNGFFELMVQMNGNTRGQIVPTRPVLRDYASTNRSGIVWADDLDDLEAYGELLRASTSDGTAAKMDADRSGIKNTRIVAPILITGEALGMNGQKALADRSVILRVSSPKERRSLHDPNRMQWDDILDLKAKYPDDRGGLSVLAGHYVQMALQYAPQVMQALREARRGRSGRHGEKLAVLEAGAVLLDLLTGQEGRWSGLVREWTARAGQGGLDRDNTLTMSVVPWALRVFGFPTAPEAGAPTGRFQGIETPAFIRQGEGETLQGTTDDTAGPQVWVSASLLAMAWHRDRMGRVRARTETEDALAAQIQILVQGRGKHSKVFRVQGSTQRRRYTCLPPEYSQLVLDRARGLTE